MSTGPKALAAPPVAWRILLDGVWTDCYDPELVAKCRQSGYAVESLYTRQQLQDAYEEGREQTLKIAAEGE